MLKAGKVFYILLLIYFAVSFALFVNRFVSAMAYPYDLVGGEGMVFNESLKLCDGEQIYTDINKRPYYISNYPPLFQFVSAGVMLVSGQRTLFAGRLISLLSTMGVALLIFLIVRRKVGASPSGFFAVLFFLSFWYIFDYAPFGRVDMFGLFFGLLGLYWVDRYRDSNKVYLACLFFILSIFTKQSYIFAPAAAFLFLLTSQRKKAFIFAGTLAAGVLALIALGNAVTEGEFQKHVFMSFNGVFYADRALSWLINFIRTYYAYIALCVYAVYRQVKHKEYSPYLFYLFLSAVPMIAVGRIGGYSNYYFEICITIAIQAGIAVSYVLKDVTLRTRTIILILLCLQMNNLTAIDFNGEYLMLSRKPGWTHIPSAKDSAERERISAAVKECGGLAISETSMIYLLADKTPPKEFHSFLQHYIPGWDPSNFLADLEAGRYACVVTEDRYEKASGPDVKMKAFDAAKYRIIARDFHLKESVGKINIYERDKPAG